MKKNNIYKATIVLHYDKHKAEELHYFAKGRTTDEAKKKVDEYATEKLKYHKEGVYIIKSIKKYITKI